MIFADCSHNIMYMEQTGHLLLNPADSELAFTPCFQIRKLDIWKDKSESFILKRELVSFMYKFAFSQSFAVNKLNLLPPPPPGASCLSVSTPSHTHKTWFLSG
jgi:hypothetical protein